MCADHWNLKTKKIFLVNAVILVFLKFQLSILNMSTEGVRSRILTLSGAAEPSAGRLARVFPMRVESCLAETYFWIHLTQVFLIRESSAFGFLGNNIYLTLFLHTFFHSFLLSSSWWKAPDTPGTSFAIYEMAAAAIVEPALGDPEPGDSCRTPQL